MIMKSKTQNYKSSSTLLKMLFMVLVCFIGLTGCSRQTKSEDITTTPQITTAPEVSETEVNSDIDTDTEPTQPAQVTPEVADQNQDQDLDQALYFGEWVINKVLAYGVGTYSSEDAESLIGKSLSFTEDQANFFTDELTDIEKIAKNPVYTETISSESDFIVNYRMPFDNLGIEADSITEINVSDSDGHVCTFFVKDDNTLILVGGGTYFELVKKSN
jgi:hypothetical protein